MEASSSKTIEESPGDFEIAEPLEEKMKKPDPGGTFKCNYCSLEEHYDYKGENPPFAKKISFSEHCYVMEDPWNPSKRGQFLVLGGDCSECKKSVCLSCSLFYVKRFCRECANESIKNFPSQLHSKIKNLNVDENT